MSGPFGPLGPTPHDVRSAAQALKDAIDSHLFAVQTRMGEQDPAVQRAFDLLQQRAETYDDVLYQVYDEVTPFEFGGGGEIESDDIESVDMEIPPVVSLLVRRDYAVLDPQLLVRTGRDAFRAMREMDAEVNGAVAPGEQEPTNLPTALYAMFQFAGVDGFDMGSADAGLEQLGGAVWFLAGDDPALVDVDAPFDDLDVERLIFRILEVPDVEGAEEPDGH